MKTPFMGSHFEKSYKKSLEVKKRILEVKQRSLEVRSRSPKSKEGKPWKQG
jgi:hypothetical protein